MFKGTVWHFQIRPVMEMDGTWDLWWIMWYGGEIKSGIVTELGDAISIVIETNGIEYGTMTGIGIVMEIDMQPGMKLDMETMMKHLEREDWRKLLIYMLSWLENGMELWKLKEEFWL